MSSSLFSPKKIKIKKIKKVKENEREGKAKKRSWLGVMSFYKIEKKKIYKKKTKVKVFEEKSYGESKIKL